jgi:hypothetical protein
MHRGKLASIMRSKHTLIRDVVTGVEEAVRYTEAIEVEIDWPDPAGLNLNSRGVGGSARIGDWRVVNPPPMGWMEAMSAPDRAAAKS